MEKKLRIGLILDMHPFDEISFKKMFDEMEGIEVPSTSLNDDRANVGNPIPMIYQSGCLTIFVIIRNLDSILCRSVSSVVSKNRLFCLFHQHF